MAESHDQIEVQESSEGESVVGCGKWYRLWWKCDNEAVVSEFLTESSLHGLKYIGQPNRNVVERSFWIVTFIVGIIAAVFLIYGVFSRYEDTPVTMSFQSKEQSVDTIPFPAVTFCFNMQFTKEKVESLNRSRDGFMEGEPEYDAISAKLALIDDICESRKSFFRAYFGSFFYHNNAREDYFHIKNQSKYQLEIIDLLLEFTPSCEDLIPFVRLDGSNILESNVQIFHPVITEYGKCCTFNMLPTPLMLKQPSASTENEGDIFNNPVLGTKSKQWWLQRDIDDWQKWSYEKGFILSPDSYKTRISWEDGKISRPYRNERLGYSFGFSVVINTFEPYCEEFTFHGTTFMLHNPVDTPRVSQFPSVIGSREEVFIKIHPDITLADPDIYNLKIEKRQCLFGKEETLKYFRPYTQENCFEDCIANLIEKECGCSMFYMPRPNETVLCELNSKTFEGKCVSDTLGLLSKKEICRNCLPLCEYIDYNFEITTARILTLFGSKFRKLPGFDRDWTGKFNESKDEIYRNASIAHIFYASPSTVPKLRKRLYGITDLIANTGGILGLCLGFSVLSVAEVLYYVLMRTIWQMLSSRCVWCNTNAASASGKPATMVHKNAAKSNYAGSDKKSKCKRTKVLCKFLCRKRSGLLRFNWLCCILVGSVTSGFLVYMLVIKKDENTKDTFKVPVETSKYGEQYWAEATFCYVNQFSMETVLQLRRVAEFTTDEDRRYSAETNLSIIDAMCKYKDDLETLSSSEFSPTSPDVANYTFLMKFLEENAMSCLQMFPGCVYMGVVQENCNKIITTVNTVYGKCCRVFIAPEDPNVANSPSHKLENTTERLNVSLNLSWTDHQNYKTENSSLLSIAKFNSSYFLVHGANLSAEFSRSMQPFHFSVLSNVNEDFYQCNNSTASTNQFLFSLQSPGKIPQKQDFSLLPVANEEVVLTIVPEVVTSVSPEEVMYDEEEKCTPFYWDDDLGVFQSTKAAYFDGCYREFVHKNCKCALLGYESGEIELNSTCKTGSNFTDTICVRKMNELVRKLKRICYCTGPNCYTMCRGTAYSYISTNQSMTHAEKLWASLTKFGNDTTSAIPWANNKTGIIHFTFSPTRPTSKSTNHADKGVYLAMILLMVVSSLICLFLIVFPYLWRCICGMIVKRTLYLHGALHTRKT